MNKQNVKLINTLWTLPGGNKHYLDTLDRLLKWIASKENPTKDDLVRWFQEKYNVGDGTVSGYINVPVKMGLIRFDDGRVQLTPFGKEVMNAEGEQKAALIAQRLLNNFSGIAEILTVYEKSGQPTHIKDVAGALNHLFPKWTSINSYEYRALWLLSLGCLRQVKGREYEITDFGRRMLAEYYGENPVTVETVKPVSPPLPDDTPKPSPVDDLIRELEEAATDSAHPQRLETAVARAFEYLGFFVDQWGESGETDVFLQANVGEKAYRVVVDAKSRGKGILQDLPVTALKEHGENNQADYIVVVAGAFSHGRVLRDAKNNGIVLLSVPVLAKWLRLHEKTPLNLDIYRAMFTQPGELETIPASIISAQEDRLSWINLIVDLLALVEETYEHGLVQPLPSEQLFSMLVTRLRGVRYPRDQVSDILDLLTHPAIGAMLGDGKSGVTLAMSRQTLARVFRTFADQIETKEPEIEE